jgi:adenylyl- and sulfurtransferase ThiI
MDKLEVMNIGREIGTYEISTAAKDGCQAVPKWPMTHARLVNYMNIEKRLDIEEILSNILESAEIIEIHPLGD